jgi:hypothetical protein
MMPIRQFIFSLPSPDAASWIGFVVLATALIAAAGLFLLPDKLGKSHKLLGVFLVVLAACGYAIERLGDDAMTGALTPRTVPPSVQSEIRQQLKAFGPLVAVVGTTPKLGHTFDIDSLADQIAGILAVAGSTAKLDTIYFDQERPVGVWVVPRTGESKASAAADVLVAAFNKARIVAHKDPKAFGGPKPPPPSPPSAMNAPAQGDSGSGAGTTAVDDDWYRLGVALWEQQVDLQVVVGTKP